MKRWTIIAKKVDLSDRTWTFFLNRTLHQGWILDLLRGGAKLTQWRRMRRLSSWTCMYGSTLLHKFFLTPPIFPSEEQKKRGGGGS